MSRAFLICPEPIRELTAGVGTRFLALAGVLQRAGHRVTLGVPNDPAEAGGVPEGVTVVGADPGGLGEQAEGHDWVLLHGHLGNHYLAQRDDLPVVVDLYDPFLVDNLHYWRELGLAPFRTDHATWRLQMSRGDFFLCSSEEQRSYYLGWLTALGRVNPPAVEADPDLRRLIDELPFGVPEDGPPAPPWREEILPGCEGPVLYFGGIYDWYDPGVVLEALPMVLEGHPGATVVFVEHPHPEITPQSAASAARRAARQRGWLGREVRFADWHPGRERFALPLVADLAVVTHRPGLEATLSFRTRLVDLLWLGLPVVATEGGAMSRVLRETGAGVVVPPGDAGALARAVLGLLDDPERCAAASRAGRSWAAGRRWDRVAGPLLRYAANPWRDPHRQATPVDPGDPDVRDSLATRLARRLQRGGRR
ncbi:MAG: glycosyltransferase family 4 protein [Acidobacteria bacterium]|nr:glycosyltransferase family 4 protein [Acidobacteriota bacterium]